MAAEFSFAGAPRIHDRYWRRLTWLLPAVVVSWVLLLSGLGSLLKREPLPAPPRPIDAMLIEMPADAAPARREESAPPAPISEPKPPPPRPSPRIRPHPRPVERPVSEESAPPEPAQTPEEPASSSPPIPPSPPQASVATPDTRAPAQTSRTGARVIFNPLPKIPDELRDRASETEALARFDIRADGTATVALVKPTPDPTLNRVILQTLQTWRFFPAMENGRPVPSSQEVRIQLQVR